jgi:cellulose synthase/poly-beta-1,6-N-acetylglucosamine synthase-like glycosyltransferase
VTQARICEKPPTASRCDVLRDFLFVYTIVAFVYFAVLNALYLALTVVAWVEMGSEIRARRYLGLEEVFRSPLTPGVSVLVPAYNEEAVIVESVRSLLSLRYPQHEVVVVSDGSTDRTVEVLADAFDLVPFRKAIRDGIPTAAVHATYVSRTHPGLVVVDKDNGGRADALNVGVNVARHPYVCVIDADSLLEEDALLKVAKPILDDPQLLAATGGTVRVANGCRIDHGRVVEVRLPKSRLATVQVLEYFRAFLVARVGWSRLNALGIISGAFGLFHRSILEAVGGYWRETVGEDFELTLRLHRYLRERGEPYRIAFVSDPVAWTEVPADLTTLGRQRRRWQRGLWEGLRRHARLIANPRYGIFGLLAMPYFVLFEFLSPIFGLLGLVVTTLWWTLGGLSAPYFVAFLIVSIGFGLLLTTAALALEEFSYRRYRRRRDIARLLAYAVLENVGYRQLHDVWRALGYVDIARGERGWGAQRRRGFGGPQPRRPLPQQTTTAVRRHPSAATTAVRAVPVLVFAAFATVFALAFRTLRR